MSVLYDGVSLCGLMALSAECNIFILCNTIIRS